MAPANSDVGADLKHDTPVERDAPSPSASIDGPATVGRGVIWGATTVGRRTRVAKDKKNCRRRKFADLFQIVWTDDGEICVRRR